MIYHLIIWLYYLDILSGFIILMDKFGIALHIIPLPWVGEGLGWGF